MAHMGTCLTVIDLDGSKHAVTRSCLFYCYGGKNDGVPLTLLHDAARIPDFGRNLKRPAAIIARCLALGYVTETRFDAAHGRRYMLGAYGGAAFSPERATQRRIVLAAMAGIENLREYHEWKD